MRIAVATLIACASLAAFEAAAEVQGVDRTETHIPPQSLGTALRTLAKERNFQLVYVASEVDPLRSEGASGVLTSEEALTQLLRGTGMTYRTLEHNGVSIVPAIDRLSPQAPESDSQSASQSLARNRSSDAVSDSRRSTKALRLAQDERADSTLVMRTESQGGSSADDADMLQEVVVTGTSIHGIRSIGSSMTALSREQVVETGATTTTEVLRSLPQLASFNATGINGGQDQANFLDQPAIHGIGVGNGGGGLTLVLMNGERLPGAGINQTAPDPSAIPTAAIERIEIIADGASSIYGSDAVAGVLNFILRKDFDGAQTSIKAGTASGYDTLNMSQILGKTGENGAAMLVLEHSQNSAVQGTERSYYGDDQVSRGGVDARSTLCSPANVMVSGRTYGLSQAGAAPGIPNRCENNVASDLYPDQERNQAYISLRQRLTDSVELFANAVYSDRIVRDREAASGSSNSKGGLAVIVPGGPFYDFAVGLGVPAGAPHTVTYNPASDIASAFTNPIRARTQSTRLGANVGLGGDWIATFQGNYGLERDAITQRGINQSLALAAAANGTLNPYGVGPPTSAAALAAVGDYESRYTARQTLKEVSAKADGSLFMTPAGMAKGALGMSRREETFAAGFREGPIEGPDAFPAVSTQARRQIFSAFGEVFIPLVGENLARPGMSSVQLSLSARYDDYDGFGNTTNPKVGLDWHVLDQLSVTASYGRSFHAPSLADSPAAIDTRALRFADRTGSADPSAYSVILAGGNDLQPETATTYSAGLTWNSGARTGATANLTYWKVNYRNVITFPTFAPLDEPDNPVYDRFRTLNPALAQVQQQTAGFRHDGLIFPDVSNLPTALYDLRRLNFAEQNIDGIDFDLAYGFDTRAGPVRLDLSGTYLFDFDQQIKGDARTTSRLDTNAAIRMRARATLGWQRTWFAADLFVNYTDSYRNTTQGGMPVHSFTTLDAHLAWTFSGGRALKNLELSLDGTNILDQDPPFYFDPGSNANQHGYDAVAASALGRIVTLGLRKTF